MKEFQQLGGKLINKKLNSYGNIPKSVIKLLIVLKTFVESSNRSPPKTQSTHRNAAPRD